MTADGGKTWFEGKIDAQDTVKEPRHYGWTVWSADVKVIGKKGIEYFPIIKKARHDLKCFFRSTRSNLT